MEWGLSRILSLTQRELLGFPNLTFEVVYRTDSYREQRGLEQVLYDRFEAPLDKIRPISPRNPNRGVYMQSAGDFLERLENLERLGE